MEIKMGQMPKVWNDRARDITFCVTEDCNLACKYCYMIGKNNKNKLSIDTAKKFIDYVLSNRGVFIEEAVVWEFIGGEPFLEIELIDEICDYIKLQMYDSGHPWFNNYRFNFSTNGILYNDIRVQNFIKKNLLHLSIGISIDGNKIKHDLQRVKRDGSGSYDDVVKNVPLWQEQLPHCSTKATFSHDDLPYLKDSIISLWNLGLKMVSANIVFEDVWNEGDDVIFENQLKELADYIIENNMWKDYSVRFFDPTIGFPLDKDQRKKNRCGAGKMLAMDTKGNFFPCIRFYDMSLSNKKGYSIGNVEQGIDTNKIRPFLALDYDSQSDEKCINCEIASGCAWCTGCNYDMADTYTIYQRSTSTCKMHKANVKANIYFWDKFSIKTGLMSEREKIANERNHIDTKYLKFITSRNISCYCGYTSSDNIDTIMDNDILIKGLKFANKNGFTSVFFYANALNNISHNAIYETHTQPSVILSDVVTTYSNLVDDKTIFKKTDICIFSYTRDDIESLYKSTKALLKNHRRVNLMPADIEKWTENDISLYDEQLDLLACLVEENYSYNNFIEINILTDLLNLKDMCNCGAGESEFSLAPNGKIYICPAFYFNDPNLYVGDIEQGINIKNSQLLNIKNAPICSKCDVYHCKRCKYLNRKLTNEYNTPSKVQCHISHIERKNVLKLQTKLNFNNLNDVFTNVLTDIDYNDPLEKILNENWGRYIDK